MGKENMMGQENITTACPDNETHDKMHCMMHCCMMGNHSANGTMMMEDDSFNETMMHCCMMGDHSANGTIMMEDHLANETMIHCCMMGDHSANETMNETMTHCCMMGEHPADGSYCTVEMDQNASAAQAKLECARFWLEQAIELHELHMKDPSTATNESQLEMMEQMMQAYECMTGENMTMGMMNNTTGVQFSEEYEHRC
jgi:hypothetical protein